jgi:hypothetical protein
MNFATLEGSAMSSCSGKALPLIMLADFFELAMSREHTMTLAPRVANSLAISKPMPLLAPVTIATLPSNNN